MTMPRFRRHNYRAAKVTPEDVVNIRQAYEDGATQGELARQYGVGVGTIGRMVRGESWQALPTAAAPTAPRRTDVELEADSKAAMAAALARDDGDAQPLTDAQRELLRQRGIKLED